LRVIAGSAKSLPLKAPKGFDTRPTSDRVKETLFNILAPDLPGCVFIDLFAGSGAIGIEAISRGARRAYFAENSNPALQCLAHNLAFTKLAEKATVLRTDARAALLGINESVADIVFMDPPYGHSLEKHVLETLAKLSYVKQSTIVVAEAARGTDFSYIGNIGFTLYRVKEYLHSCHVFMRLS